MAYLVLAGTSLDRAFSAVRHGLLTATPSDVHTLRPGSCANTAEDLRKIDLSCLYGILPEGQPIELFVPGRNQRRRFSDFSFSVCPEEFPPGAFMELTPRVLMYSPVQYFLYKCRSFSSDIQRIKFGMELAGRYAHGLPGREDLPCVYDVPPALDADQLRSYLGKASGFYGVKVARAAADQVIGNAYSPMETIVALEQCLPIEFGGRAYPRPSLNEEIVVPRTKRRMVARDSFRPDIFWGDAMLDEEYDGGLHNSSEMVEHDKARLADIQTLGIQVIPATALSLRSFERAELLGRQVGKALAERCYGEDMAKHLRILEDLDLTQDRRDLHAQLMAFCWDGR